MKKLKDVLYGFIQNRFSGREITIYFVFVCISFLWWYFFSLRMPCETNIKIPITFSGRDVVLKYSGDVPQYVRVRISDIGYKLRRFHHQDLVLELPIEDRITALHGHISINHNMLLQSIMRLFPESVTVKDFEPRNIDFAYTVLKKKVVPVILDATFAPLPQHWFSHSPRLLQTQIEIVGPESVIDTMRAIRTIGGVQALKIDSGIVQLPLVIPDSISVVQNFVDVSICTELFTEKTFTLPIQVVDIPLRQNIRLFPSCAQVIVKVSKRNFDLISEEDFEVRCSFPERADQPVLPLSVVHTSSSFIQVKILPQHVEYIIEK